MAEPIYEINMYESEKYCIIEILNNKDANKSMYKLDAALKRTFMDMFQSPDTVRPDSSRIVEIIKEHAEALNFPDISVTYDTDHTGYLFGIQYDIFICTFGKFQCKIYIAQ